MQIKCGTDIIEVDRIQKSIEEFGEIFKNRIYTEKEIEYCEKRGKAKYQHYAARFAAKEAIFKAISATLEHKFDFSWKNAEVLNDENGRPYINFIDFDNSKIKNIDISLSHCNKYAVANVSILL